MLRAYTQSGPIIAPKRAPCVITFGYKGLAPAKKEQLADHSMVLNSPHFQRQRLGQFVKTVTLNTLNAPISTLSNGVTLV